MCWSLGAVCVEGVVGGVSFSGFCRRFVKLLGEVVACGEGRLSLAAFHVWQYCGVVRWLSMFDLAQSTFLFRLSIQFHLWIFVDYVPDV
ncbi:hypothetical protein F2Q69_00061404 [Brassica cretica]|uniref:Uncharacterized protein n=1 Tax=Brassica cretica TaxID=69181 RepID=A0A8S9RC79_BRACR|nr:hypothetical protein F2Q69_00061404 [Brassica cretica]